MASTEVTQTLPASSPAHLHTPLHWPLTPVSHGEERGFFPVMFETSRSGTPDRDPGWVYEVGIADLHRRVAKDRAILSVRGRGARESGGSAVACGEEEVHRSWGLNLWSWQ